MDQYPRILDAMFVGADMKTYPTKAPEFLDIPRMYKDYGLLLADIFYGIYNLDTTPRKHVAATALSAFQQSKLKLTATLGDALKAVRAL